MRHAFGVAGWRVLLIGGSSGVGKSTAAEALGRRLGVPWFQVDDLRLALQRSRPRLPGGTEWALDYFDDPDRWRDPEAARDALVAICDLLQPAVEIVAANHVAIRRPLVLEGDGIHPAVVERLEVRPAVERGLVRAVFLVEPEEAVVLANMRVRNREGSARPAESTPGWARLVPPRPMARRRSRAPRSARPPAAPMGDARRPRPQGRRPARVRAYTRLTPTAISSSSHPSR